MLRSNRELRWIGSRLLLSFHVKFTLLSTVVFYYDGWTEPILGHFALPLADDSFGREGSRIENFSLLLNIINLLCVFPKSLRKFLCLGILFLRKEDHPIWTLVNGNQQQDAPFAADHEKIRNFNKGMTESLIVTASRI